MRTLQRRFALIRRYVLGVSLFVPLFFAQGHQPQAAMVVLFDADGAIGISDLAVDSVFYDIDFVNDSYNDAFPGEKVFSNATNISAAIVTALNMAGAPNLSTPPSLSNVFFVPRNIDSPTQIDSRLASCKVDLVPGDLCDSSWLVAGIVGLTRGDDNFWAVPTLSPVPLPAALPLFGSALAMLGIVGWRRRRQAGA